MGKFEVTDAFLINLGCLWVKPCPNALQVEKGQRSN